MQNSLPTWLLIMIAVVPLAGAVTTSLVMLYSNLKTKKMELFYARRADAYKELMINAGVFSRDPTNEQKYEEFLRSYNVAFMLASSDVALALAGREGLSVTAQRLRVAESEKETLTLQTRDWYKTIGIVVNAMRADLQKL